MKKILRNITLTCDAGTHAHFFGRRRTGDEILNAIPPGRILCLGTIWTGELAPAVTRAAAAIAANFLSPGLSVGGVLHAEPAPDTLDLGRQWLGALQTRILASAADFASQRPEEAGDEPGTDIGEVIQQLDRLRRDMGTADRAKIRDGVSRLQAAADRVSRSRDEAERHGAFSEGRRIADATARRVADINQRNADFWNRRSSTPSLDSRGRMNWRTGDAAPAETTAFRDAMHAAANAATPREQISALNRAAKSFWSRGEPPTVTGDALRRTPAPTTIGEINARNRAYWAGRS